MAWMTNKSHFIKSFNIDDTAIILINHEIGIFGWVHSVDADLLKKNVSVLATFARKTKMPLAQTSSMFVILQLICSHLHSGLKYNSY